MRYGALKEQSQSANRHDPDKNHMRHLNSVHAVDACGCIEHPSEEENRVKSASLEFISRFEFMLGDGPSTRLKIPKASLQHGLGTALQQLVPGRTIQQMLGMTIQLVLGMIIQLVPGRTIQQMHGMTIQLVPRRTTQLIPGMITQLLVQIMITQLLFPLEEKLKLLLKKINLFDPLIIDMYQYNIDDFYPE